MARPIGSSASVRKAQFEKEVGMYFETEGTILDRLWACVDEGDPRKTWSRSICGGICWASFSALHERDRELAKGE